MYLRLTPQWRTPFLALGRTCRVPPYHQHIQRYQSSLSKGDSAVAAPLPTSNGDSQERAPSEEEEEHPEWKRQRNQFIRSAFAKGSEEGERYASQMIDSPFVPTERKYPSDALTHDSSKHAKKIARILGGYRVLFTKRSRTTQQMESFPTFEEIFEQLQRITRHHSTGKNKTLALRIKLPFSFDFQLPSARVSFVDSVTGVLSKLRVSGYHQDRSTIILRGKAPDLKHAADEFIRKFQGVEILELGEVTAIDYQSKQIWPSVEILPAEKGGREKKPASAPSERLYNIVVHKTAEPIWLDHRFEDIPKPETWTEESFEQYMTQVIDGQIPSHLALKLYKRTLEKDSQLIDLYKPKVALIQSAIMDPSALQYITPAIFNKALNCLAHAGGHIAAAAEIFAYAEAEGVPLDITSFNIMLKAQFSAHNLPYFYTWIHKMEARWFRPDGQTWLILLFAVQKDDVRRRIIAFMYQNGYLQDVATKREIARINASTDAYACFNRGGGMAEYLQDQEKLYGAGWFTMRAVPDILKEYLAFHQEGHALSQLCSDIDLLLGQPTYDDIAPNVHIINKVLQVAASTENWPLALWAVAKANELSIPLASFSYDALLRLAYSTQSPHALSVLFFYGVTSRNLRRISRAHMLDIFGRSRGSFWGKYRPLVFTNPMSAIFRSLRYKNTRLSRIEWVILDNCKGRIPTEPLDSILQKAIRLDEPFQQVGEQGHKGGDEAAALTPLRIDMADPNGERRMIYVLENYIEISYEPQFREKRALRLKQQNSSFEDYDHHHDD